MKIGLYIGYLMSGSNPGAPKHYLISLARQLIRYEDIDLHLITDKMGDHPLYSEEKLIMLPRLPILNTLELAKHKLDLIHFNFVPVTPGLLSIIFLTGKARKVCTVHGDIFYAEPSLSNYGDSYYTHYVRLIQPRVSKWFDMIMPVSANLGDRLAQHWEISKDKLRPVHHGIDHDIFRPIPDAKTKVMQKYGLERDFILHVSNYSLRKNPSGLLSTFEQLVEDGVNVDLVITGNRWREKIQQFPKRNLKVTQRIKVLGSVPIEDLPLFYSAAQLFFFPTYHENFGFPNIEAMACGAPVVTSKVYSVPEVTGDAAILCDPDSVSDFVTAIRHVLEDDNLRNEMIGKGLEHARRFTWEKCAKETIEVYKEVMNK